MNCKFVFLAWGYLITRTLIGVFLSSYLNWTCFSRNNFIYLMIRYIGPGGFGHNWKGLFEFKLHYFSKLILFFQCEANRYSLLLVFITIHIWVFFQLHYIYIYIGRERERERERENSIGICWVNRVWWLSGSRLSNHLTMARIILN